jgi:hypothetical protein
MMAVKFRERLVVSKQNAQIWRGKFESQGVTRDRGQKVLNSLEALENLTAEMDIISLGKLTKLN